jgi:histidinol-phosphate aminotransferase
MNFSLVGNYPEKHAASLKKKIAGWLSVESDQVVVGNGSDQIVDLIAKVFLGQKVTCLVQVPTFFRIIDVVRQSHAKLITVSTIEDNFCLKTEKLIKRLNPQVVWLCSPNNPTGETIDSRFIARIAKKTKGLVIVDEAYQEIFDPQNKFSAVRLIKRHKNVLVTKSFSKAFDLAEIRVGMAIAHKNIAGALEKNQLNFPISMASQQTAEKALDDIKSLKNVHRYFEKERKFLFSNIDKLSNLERCGNSKTNIFILRHKRLNLFDLLLKENIETADFNKMNGLESQGFVRITIKNHPENIQLLNTLQKVSAKI